MSVATGKDGGKVKQKRVIELRKRNQIGIPKEIVEQLGLEEGDTLEISVEGDRIVLEPVVTIPRAQAYFWTEQWQKWEREADKAYEAGKTIGPIKTRKELKAFLDSLKEKTDDVEE